MKISVITPTMGTRESSFRFLVKHLSGILMPGDEHIIVLDADVFTPDFMGQCLNDGKHSTPVYLRKSVDSGFGNIQRDVGIIHAKGDYIVFCDDDDVLSYAGIRYLRTLPVDKTKCHLFPSVGAWGNQQPTTCFERGYIQGAQFVVPNVDSLPKWADTTDLPAGDFEFMTKCKKQFEFVHHTVPLCVLRPDQYNTMHLIGEINGD